MWQESSVDKFGAVHAKVMEGHNEKETTRGLSLRELDRFFKEHDKDEGYAGLRRVSGDDGAALWTLLEGDRMRQRRNWRSEPSSGSRRSGAAMRAAANSRSRG